MSFFNQVSEFITLIFLLSVCHASRFAKMESDTGSSIVADLYPTRKELLEAFNYLATAMASDQCGRDLSACVNNSIFFQMIDSWGKPEAGLSGGNVFWIGRPSQCNALHLTDKDVNTAAVKFSDRIVKLILKSKYLGNTDLPIFWDICLPESCGKDETAELLEFLANYVNTKLGSGTFVLVVELVVLANPGTFDFSFYLAVVVFSIILACIVVATIFDYFLQEVYRKRRSEWRKMSNMYLDSDEPEVVYESSGTLKRALITSMGLDNMELESSFNVKLLLSFSLKSNIPKLLSCSTSASTIKCLNGIRVLSINWVVLGHTLFFLGLIQPVSPSINFLEFLNHYSRRWMFLTISNGTFAVDSFFVLSGFLATYLILPKLPHLKTKLVDCEQICYWMKYVIKRYIRLVPSMAAVILFSAGIWKVLGNGTGAMWQPNESAMGNCRDVWWTNVLLINNFVEVDKMCIGWTWYLADDFQFYLLGIIFFSLHLRLKGTGVLAVFMLMVASMVASFLYSFKHNLPPEIQAGWPLSDPNVPNYNRDWHINFDSYYIKPYFRFPAYAVGILLGFITFKHPPLTFYMPKYVNVIGWIFSLTTFSVVLYSLTGIFHGHYPSFFESALYNCLSRPLWSLALSWVIFSCMHGYGGIINTFLCWKLWVPLGKLTYMVYLIHPLLMVFYYSTSEQKFLYSDLNYAFAYIGLLTVTYITSFFAVLMIESPLVQIEKLLSNRISTPQVLLQ